MNWKEYEAATVVARARGESLQSMRDLVLEVVRTYPSGLKREDIASLVSCRTGVYLVDVMNNVSTILKQLKDQGLIYSPTRGYWAAYRTAAPAAV